MKEQETKTSRHEFSKKLVRSLDDAIKIATGEKTSRNDIYKQIAVWQSWADEIEVESK